MECLKGKNQSPKYTSILIHCHLFVSSFKQNRNLIKITGVRNLQTSEDANEGKGDVSYIQKANGQTSVLKKKQFYDFSSLMKKQLGKNLYLR